MFDIGFSELLVIGLVALIVLGPQQMVKMAKTAGVMMGRLQRYVATVKADIAREVELDELRKMQTEMKDAARSFEDTINKEVHAAQSAVEEPLRKAEAEFAELASPSTSAESSTPAIAAPSEGAGAGAAAPSADSAPAAPANTSNPAKST